MAVKITTGTDIDAFASLLMGFLTAPNATSVVDSAKFYKKQRIYATVFALWTNRRAYCGDENRESESDFCDFTNRQGA